jgi:hypothetical protein
MSSFFSTTPNSDKLLVSSQISIFWSIAIPLTVVVIVIYTLWTQRAEVRAWYAEKRRKKYQRQQKRLGSENHGERDLEKGEKRDGVGKEIASSQEDRKQV